MIYKSLKIFTIVLLLLSTVVIIMLLAGVNFSQNQDMGVRTITMLDFIVVPIMLWLESIEGRY